MPPDQSTPIGDSPFGSRARVDMFVAVIAVVIAAAAGLVFSTAVGSTRGRIAASTQSEASVFSAANVDVTLDAPRALRFDADTLFPGRVVERCLQVGLTGSIDGVDLRLLGRRNGGTGLERYIDTTISVGEGVDAACTDFLPSRSLFAGRLASLWEDHGDFASGLDVGATVDRDFRATVRITATVVDDNGAQGLDTEFWLTFEARP